MSNVYFEKLQRALSRMNIKNNSFFLNTINPDIENIDLFSEDLTDEQKTLIDTECSENIWFFLREAVRFPNGSQYKMNLSNLASTYCAIHGISHYVINAALKETNDGISALMLYEVLYKDDYDKIILNNYADSGVFVFHMKIYDTLKSLIRMLPNAIIEARNVVIDEKHKSISVNDVIKFQVCPYLAVETNKYRIMDMNDGRISIFPDFDKNAINADMVHGELTSPLKRYYKIYTTHSNRTPSGNFTEAAAIFYKGLKWTDAVYDMDIEEVKRHVCNRSMTNMFTIKHSLTQLGITNRGDIDLVTKRYAHNYTTKPGPFVTTRDFLRLVSQLNETLENQGIAGVTFVPNVSEHKVLSWTNNGGLENPEPVDLNPFDDWIDDSDDGQSGGMFIWEDEE